jgi:hypothetical protein
MITPINTLLHADMEKFKKAKSQLRILNLYVVYQCFSKRVPRNLRVPQNIVRSSREKQLNKHINYLEIPQKN